jgi:hypothetical protein
MSLFSFLFLTNETTNPCSLRFPAPAQSVYSVAASACPVRPSVRRSRTRRAKSSPWKRSVSRTLDAIEEKKVLPPKHDTMHLAAGRPPGPACQLLLCMHLRAASHATALDVLETQVRIGYWLVPSFLN